jgi:hypothetical protein
MVPMACSCDEIEEPRVHVGACQVALLHALCERGEVRRLLGANVLRGAALENLVEFDAAGRRTVELHDVRVALPDAL